MPDTQIETSPKRGETAAQFKDRIEETRRELERQEALKPQPVPASVPVPSAPAAAPAQVGAQGNVAQPPEVPPASATRGVIPEVDEWWSKKGFKTPEDIASSYRELERELNKKNQELARTQAPAQPFAPPPPQYPPYYAPPPQQWLPPAPPTYQPQPMYQPPIPQQTADQLAEQYGLSTEDFKKVYSVANDLSQVTVQRELNRIMPGIVQQVQRVNGEVTRQREMVDLMSEPTWKNPQVQFEMHKVLNEDPTIIQRQALPYRYAHDEALKRIARVNLGGSIPFVPTPTPGFPSNAARPPATAGGNGKGAEGAAGGAGTGEITQEQFAALPLDEKREFLRTIGAIGK